MKFNMVNTALAGQFNLHMQVALATAIAVAVPYLLWEIWRFVVPALTEHERRKAGCSCCMCRFAFLQGSVSAIS